MKKKIITILLTLVMILAMIPMTTGIANAAVTELDISNEADITAALSQAGPQKWTITADISLSNPINIDREIEIDLNGKKIDNSAVFAALIRVNNGGKLTITNSSLDGKGSIEYVTATNTTGTALFYVEGGELVINKGKYSVNIPTDHSAQCVNVFSGTSTINGGTFSIISGDSSSAVVACTKASAGTESVLNINGGTFNGSSTIKAFHSWKDNDFGTINVKAGTFKGTLSTNSGANIPYIHITGGTFSQNWSKNGGSAPYALSEIIEDACIVVTLDTNPATYEVRKLYPEVWQPYFETLALKIQAQAEVEAAKMLEDAKVTVKEEEPVAEVIEIADVKSEQTIAPNGKNSVKVTWIDSKCEGYDIYRAANNEEYKFMFNTTNDYYYNTLIRAGQKYSYKVKGYNTVDGEKVYTDFSAETTCVVK